MDLTTSIVLICAGVVVVILLLVIAWRVLFPSFVRRVAFVFLSTIGDPDRLMQEEEKRQQKAQGDDENTGDTPQTPDIPAEERFERKAQAVDFADALAQHYDQDPDIKETVLGQKYQPGRISEPPEKTTEPAPKQNAVGRFISRASRPFRFIRRRVQSKDAPVSPTPQITT
jgi:hypothetical protein